jgi:DNA phosphorothioation-dependent restriction protein DptH
VLEQYGLQAEGRHAAVLLDQLRSLSGRLALKLISVADATCRSPRPRAFASLLGTPGRFENQVIVPLDAQLELYRVLKAHANELGDAVSFRRTDLGLFDLDLTRRTVTCRLVEVKCYSGKVPELFRIGLGFRRKGARPNIISLTRRALEKARAAV